MWIGSFFVKLESTLEEVEGRKGMDHVFVLGDLNCRTGREKEWKLTVNLNTTQIVVFKKGTKLKRVETWQYQGKRVEVVNNFTYLGVNLSFNGKWNAHLGAKATKAKYVSGSLVKFARKHGECSVKLFKHLFGAMVTSAMTYGAEVFAFSPRLDELVRVERQFYKKVFGLPSGVAGVALDVAVGVVGVDVTAKLKLLNFWHKLAIGSHSGAKRLAYLQQTEWAERGLDSWGLNVKNELFKMGMGFVWNSPGLISRNKFKKVVKGRMSEIMFQNKVAELGKFSSANYLRSLRPSMQMPSGKVNGIKSERRRRCYLKLVLSAHQDLVYRIGEITCCKECNGVLDVNVVKHRLLECAGLEKARKKVDVEEFRFLGKNECRSRLASKIVSKSYWWASFVLLQEER